MLMQCVAPTLPSVPDTWSDYEPERPHALWLPTCTHRPGATRLQAPIECRQKKPTPLLAQPLGPCWQCACCKPRNLSLVLCLAPRTAHTILGRKTQAGTHPASRPSWQGKPEGPRTPSCSWCWGCSLNCMLGASQGVTYQRIYASIPIDSSSYSGQLRFQIHRRREYNSEQRH